MNKGGESLNKKDLIDFIPQYMDDLADNEKANVTISKYKRDIEQFIDFIKHDDQLKKRDLIDFKQYLKSLNLKVSTINSKIISVNRYIKFVYRELNEGEGKCPLCINVLKQQRKTSVENVASTLDLKRLKHHAKKHGMMDVYYILRVISEAGIRVEELNFITVEALKGKYIHIYNKGKYRDIVLPTDLIRELRKYCRENKIKEGYVFHSNKKGFEDKPMHRSTVWRKIQKVAGYAKVKLDVSHPHSFRHLFAKEYIKQGLGTVFDLADTMGHNDPKTTSIYTQRTLEEKREVINKLKI